jgi:hypothetical protein
MHTRTHTHASFPLQVTLPLEISTQVDAKWRDGKYYRVRIVERRQAYGSTEWEYYVHYRGRE